MDNFKKLVKDVKERFKDNNGILDILDEMENDIKDSPEMECFEVFRRLHEKKNTERNKTNDK